MAPVKSRPIFFIYLSLGLLLVCENIPQTKVTTVAHTGAGINRTSFSSNAIEGFTDFNYDHSLVWFEIDLSWTLENQIACLHDWIQI